MSIQLGSCYGARPIQLGRFTAQAHPTGWLNPIPYRLQSCYRVEAGQDKMYISLRGAQPDGYEPVCILVVIYQSDHEHVLVPTAESQHYDAGVQFKLKYSTVSSLSSSVLRDDCYDR